MGKNKNWHLLMSHCRYFDKSFIEMFLQDSLLVDQDSLLVKRRKRQSLTRGPLQNIPFYCNRLIWLVIMATKMQNLRKNIKESTP